MRSGFILEADNLACENLGGAPAPTYLSYEMQRIHQFWKTKRPVSGVPTLERFSILLESAPHIASLIRVLALGLLSFNGLLEDDHCIPGSLSDDAIDPALL